MGINGVSSYANTYTYGNVKNENVKPSKNSVNCNLRFHTHISD